MINDKRFGGKKYKKNFSSSRNSRIFPLRCVIHPSEKPFRFVYFLKSTTFSRWCTPILTAATISHTGKEGEGGRENNFESNIYKHAIRSKMEVPSFPHTLFSVQYYLSASVKYIFNGTIL